MRKIRFRTADVTVGENLLVAKFKDGKVNNFYYKWDYDEEYLNIVKWAGYKFPENYAIEHELAHHFIADHMAWNHSWAVWTDTWFEEPWPNHIAWEEHIVNNFQRYCKLGELDKERVLEIAIGLEKLNKMRHAFKALTFDLYTQAYDLVYDADTFRVKQTTKL